MTAESLDDSDILARTPGVRRRDLPRTIWILVAARTVNRLGAFTLSFLAVVLVEELGATVSDAGRIVALFGLATIPSRLLGGALADRFGRVPTMVLGLVGCSVAQLWIAASPTLAGAALGALALGLAFELYEPPSQALVADLTDESARPIAFGLLSAALAAAGAVAGLLAVALGALGLRWLLVADAGTCLLAALLVGFCVRDGVPSGTATADETGFTPSPWRDRRLLGLLASGTGFAVVYLAVVTLLPLALVARGLPAEQAGVLLTVSALTVVVGQPLLRWRLLAGDGFRAMTLGYVVLALGLALAGLASSLPAFAFAVVVWSVGDLLLMSHAWTIVAGLAPTASRGRYLAAYGLSWGVAAAVAPVAATQVLVHAGPTGSWSILGLGALLLALFQPALARLCRASPTSLPRSD